MPCRVLIADDEPLARRGLRTLLREARDVEIVAECGDGRETVQAIRAHSPDVVFLDVQMPDMGGFEVIETIGVERMPVVVFVTAYDAHALRALQVRAIDYLLKPFNRKRFHSALARARGQIATSPAYATRLFVKASDRMIPVQLADVEWFEADGNQVRIHLTGKTHALAETLQHVEARLDPRQFVRVHRSAIVRVDAIREVHPWFNGRLLLVLRSGD